MISSLLFSLALQVAPVPPSAPTQRDSEQAVTATIDAVFAAMEAGDGPALLKHVDARGWVTGVGRWRDGTTGEKRRSFAEYASRMKPGQGFVERITQPTIRMDGDIAMVWAPFTIVADGKVATCGFDHFGLVRVDDVWRVTDLTFSTRTDCGSSPM